MSGVSVIWYLLKSNVALTAVVPAARIMAGAIPIGTTLPAISVAQISGLGRNSVAGGLSPVLWTERIQVTVEAKTYAEQKNILSLILLACPNARTTINGVDCDSILDDILGPDMFDGEAGIYIQSQDFIVKWARSMNNYVAWDDGNTTWDNGNTVWLP